MIIWDGAFMAVFTKVAAAGSKLMLQCVGQTTGRLLL